MTRKVRSFLGVFGIATLIALTVRLFLIEDYRIASDSMFPNLLSGDLVFVSKSAFSMRLPFSTYEVVKFRAPARGEIVAFTLPDRGLETFVKRVAAIDGDHVEIKAGVLHVNGEPVRYPELPAGPEAGKDYGPVDIPKSHFFALGDNRDESIDSRNWGPVPYSCLKGRVSLVWLSLGPDGVRRERMGLWVK